MLRIPTDGLFQASGKLGGSGKNNERKISEECGARNLLAPSPCPFSAHHFLHRTPTNWMPGKGYPTDRRLGAEPQNYREQIQIVARVEDLNPSCPPCWHSAILTALSDTSLPLSGSCSAHHQTWFHTKYSTDGFFSGTWSGAQASVMAIKGKNKPVTQLFY